MLQKRIAAFALILASVGIAYFATRGDVRPYVLGLDLSGGTHLVFKADTSLVKNTSDIAAAMNTLVDVVGKRINAFGVSEAIVQAEEGGSIGAKEHRLIVEIPGVTDVTKAVDMVGKTPVLEFRLVRPESEKLSEAQLASSTVSQIFFPAELTGKYLSRASLAFDQNSLSYKVGIDWNSEGKALFAKITRENIGKPLAIFLDGRIVSMPVIRQEIISGSAEISGKFTREEARQLTDNLNYGALPLPISLVSTQTVGATLGSSALLMAIRAGVIAFVIVSIFLLIWYRVPGIIAILALAMYVAGNLAIFKLLPVTLSAAGIAGFVLTLGMAVDANILIFERMKEERRRGKDLNASMHEGFARAWNSIRDSNLSSIITGVILYYFASTPVIKGFALVFVIGVLVSMFTAITASRALLYAVAVKGEGKLSKFLFGSGFINKK
jgi:protein-export membrane protein SecD